MSDVTASGGPPPHTVLIQMGTAFWGSTSSRRRTSSTPELRDARAMAWQQLDRWIFVFMAAFILATVLVGFAPTSLGKIAAVEAGQRPPFPPVLHVHAVLMGAWVLLLRAQTGLVASPGVTRTSPWTCGSRGMTATQRPGR